jgi:hypothetical protein
LQAQAGGSGSLINNDNIQIHGFSLNHGSEATELVFFTFGGYVSSGLSGNAENEVTVYFRVYVDGVVAYNFNNRDKGARSGAFVRAVPSGAHSIQLMILGTGDRSNTTYAHCYLSAVACKR